MFFKRNKKSCEKKCDCREYQCQSINFSLEVCGKVEKMLSDLTERVELLEKIIGCSTALRLRVMKRNTRSKRVRGIFNKEGS